MTSKPVVVACAADHAYALPLTVMLRSALENLGRGRSMEVYISDGGLTPADRERLAASLSDRTRLHWIDPRRGAFSGVPLWGRISIAAYDKIAVGEILPDAVGKVLWLDCDTLVLDDIGSLYDRELEDRHLLAAQDPFVPRVSSRWGVVGHTELGLPTESEYFNTGVMLIDVDRWRADDVAGQSLAYLQRFSDRVFFHDQEALNAVLAGRWGKLDPTWNTNASEVRLGRSDGRGSPRIVHFAGTIKPWKHRVADRYERLYFEHVDLTAWSGWRPKRSLRSAVVGRYARSRARRFLLPLERWTFELVRRSDRRRFTGP